MKTTAQLHKDTSYSAKRSLSIHIWRFRVYLYVSYPLGKMLDRSMGVMSIIFFLFL